MTAKSSLNKTLLLTQQVIRTPLRSHGSRWRILHGGSIPYTNLLHLAVTNEHKQAEHMLCSVPSMQSHTNKELCKVSLNAEDVDPANLHDVCAIPSCASQGSAAIPVPIPVAISSMIARHTL